MHAKTQISIVLSIALLWAACASAADYYDRAALTASSSDTAIVLYGRVVDQYGSPVFKAQITGGKEYLDTNSVRFFGIETVRTETNAAGNFTFTGLLLKKLYIKAIEKRGYEALQQEKGVKVFSYDEGSLEPLFKPDPAKPVIFVLKKTCDFGLVDAKKSRMLIRGGSGGFTVDLFRGFSDPLEKISPERGAGQDIVVRFFPAQEKSGPVMEISAPGFRNGLAHKDGQGHRAPSGGYGPALLYPVPESGQAKAVVYHQGRGGKVYSRLELELEPAANNIRVTAGLYTNLQGKRTTDFDSLHSEEQIMRLTGRKLGYGGSSYREAVAAILHDTIQ